MEEQKEYGLAIGVNETRLESLAKGVCRSLGLPDDGYEYTEISIAMLKYAKHEFMLANDAIKLELRNLKDETE